MRRPFPLGSPTPPPQPPVVCVARREGVGQQDPRLAQAALVVFEVAMAHARAHPSVGGGLGRLGGRGHRGRWGWAANEAHAEAGAGSPHASASCLRSGLMMSSSDLIGGVVSLGGGGGQAAAAPPSAPGGGRVRHLRLPGPGPELRGKGPR